MEEKLYCFKRFMSEAQMKKRKKTEFRILSNILFLKAQKSEQISKLVLILSLSGQISTLLLHTKRPVFI